MKHTGFNQDINHRLPFTKYLSIITGIYCMFFILPTILLKKNVSLPYVGMIPISVCFTGTYFVLLDVITEVYGYFEAKKTLYTGLIAYSLFIAIMYGVVNINHNNGSAQPIQNDAYSFIFGNIYHTYFAVVFCTLVFDIFNIRLLSKWKFLFKGRYFIIRSVLSSSFAIILFSLVTNVVAFYSQIIDKGLNFYVMVSIVSISAKILSLIIFAIPATILANYLKHSEGIDVSYNINIFSGNQNIK